MKIISLNSHGLSNFPKFCRLLNKLRILKPDIILLQETFTLSNNPLSLPSHIAQWQSIWNGNIYLSSHLAILIPSHIPSQHLYTSPCQCIMDVTISPPILYPLPYVTSMVLPNHRINLYSGTLYPLFPPIQKLLGEISTSSLNHLTIYHPPPIHIEHLILTG